MPEASPLSHGLASGGGAADAESCSNRASLALSFELEARRCSISRDWLSTWPRMTTVMSRPTQVPSTAKNHSIFVGITQTHAPVVSPHCEKRCDGRFSFIECS